MKRLIPLLLILCLCLCACKNDTPQASEPSTNPTEGSMEAPEESVPETTEKYIEVPADLQCVCYYTEDLPNYKILTSDQAADVYTQLMRKLPDRAKSNPSYAVEGLSTVLVFYSGGQFSGAWSEDFTYYGVFELAQNGVLTQTGSPFTGTTLNYQLDPQLFDVISAICR